MSLIGLGFLTLEAQLLVLSGNNVEPLGGGVLLGSSLEVLSESNNLASSSCCHAFPGMAEPHLELQPK